MLLYGIYHCSAITDNLPKCISFIRQGFIVSNHVFSQRGENGEGICFLYL